MVKKILVAIMALIVLADLILTLLGQSPEYWRNYWRDGVPNEENPIGAFLLSVHPIYFVFFTLAWMSFLILMVRWLRRPLDIIFGFGLVLGHIQAVGSWIERIFQLTPMIRSHFLSMDAILLVAAIFIAALSILNIIFLKKKRGGAR